MQEGSDAPQGADHDRELHARLARGEEEALAVLFDRYREKLRRYIARNLAKDPRLAQRFDASDVVQEVYQDARQQLPQYLQKPSRAEAFVWLLGLAIERQLKLQRAHLETQRRSVKRQQALPDGSAGHPVFEGHTPSEEVERKEQVVLMQAALKQLKAEDQEVIRLRFFEGRGNTEVAALLGLSAETVAKRFERAMKRLRALMDGDAATGDTSA